MILVGGIGNIFFGDDAFGSEVAQRLLRRPQRPNVRVVDFGIRGLDLVFALLEPLDGVVLIDATPRGGRPGSLYVIEPVLPDPTSSPMMSLDAHRLDPVTVLTAACVMGARLNRIRIIGCEPEHLGDPEEGHCGLSDCLRNAVDEAILIVESQIEEISNDTKQHMETLQ